MRRLVVFILVIFLLGGIFMPVSAQDDEGDEFPLTIEDETGTEMTFEEPAEDVLCLSIACIDHLAQLGMTPAGMTDLLTIPYEQHFGELTEDITVIEGGMSPDLEQIAAMEPDVIIGQSGFFDNLRDALSNVAPMFLIYPNDVEDTIAELRMIGQITGRPEEAAEAIESFERKLAAYRELAPGDASVMMVFGAAEDDTMYIEASNGQTCSLFEEIAECPFDLPENPGQFAQFGYEFFSFEAILEVDPEVIFFSGYNVDRTENQEVVERLNENPQWLALSAVVDEAVYSIEPWVWRGGRGLTLMEETLDRALPILYPDMFEEPLSEEEIDDILAESEAEEEEDAS